MSSTIYTKSPMVSRPQDFYGSQRISTGQDWSAQYPTCVMIPSDSATTSQLPQTDKKWIRTEAVNRNKDLSQKKVAADVVPELKDVRSTCHGQSESQFEDPQTRPDNITKINSRSNLEQLAITRGNSTSPLDGAAASSVVSQADEWQSQFFKTKLCPYHLEGRCINGVSCRFAHSAEELRPLPDLHRTKLCETYVKKEACDDINCPFAHNPCELRTSSYSFYKVTLCNFYKKGRCWNGLHCRFAHGTSELQASLPPAAVAQQPHTASSKIKADTANVLPKPLSLHQPPLALFWEQQPAGSYLFDQQHNANLASVKVAGRNQGQGATTENVDSLCRGVVLGKNDPLAATSGPLEVQSLTLNLMRILQMNESECRSNANLNISPAENQSQANETWLADLLGKLPKENPCAIEGQPQTLFKPVDHPNLGGCHSFTPAVNSNTPKSIGQLPSLTNILFPSGWSSVASQQQPALEQVPSANDCAPNGFLDQSLDRLVEFTQVGDDKRVDLDLSAASATQQTPRSEIRREDKTVPPLNSESGTFPTASPLGRTPMSLADSLKNAPGTALTPAVALHGVSRRFSTGPGREIKDYNKCIHDNYDV